MSRSYRQNLNYFVFGKHRNMPVHFRAAVARLEKNPVLRSCLIREGYKAITDHHHNWDRGPASFRRMHNQFRRTRANRAIRMGHDAPVEKKDISWMWV